MSVVSETSTSAKGNSATDKATALVSTALGWTKDQLGKVDRGSVLYASTSVAVVMATIGLLFWNDVRKHKRARKPLGMKRNSRGKLPMSERKSVTNKVKNALKRRLVYAKKDRQIPEDVDFIVIGSGIGGLSTAAALSRCGYTVLVVEAHDRLGGCCHTFSKKFGWETGIHYVGNVQKLEKRMSALASKELAVEWLPLGTAEDGFTYDRYVFGSGEQRVEFMNRKDKRWEDLKERFSEPKDVAAIDKFHTYGRCALYTLGVSFLGRYLPDSISSLLFRFAKWKWPEVWNRNAAVVFEEIFAHNPLLALHVSGCFGDMGGFQRDNCFAMFYGLLEHYDAGGYFMKEGPNSVVRALIATVDEYGGNSLANAPVTDILLSEDGSRTVGVRIECPSGRCLEVGCSRGVVSAAGFVNTFTFLLPLSKVTTECKRVPQKWLQTVERILESPSTAHSAQHFQVFLGFDKPTDELQLPQYNTWFALCDAKHNWNYDAFLAEYRKDPLNAPLLCFVGFPSAKDSSYAQTHPGKATCTIVTEVPFDHFSEWKDTAVKARGKDYDAFKKQIAERLMELVFNEWPQLRDCVAKVEIGTPLSASHYLNAPIGESYGLQASCERFYDLDVAKTLRAKQPIEGLWLSGQDIASMGFAGGFQGGLLCASSILGYTRLACLASGRSLVRDLRRMDDLE